MARLSDEKIAEIRQLYAEIGIYSQVAKRVGCTAATVRKYCTAATAAIQPKQITPFSGTIPEIDNVDLTFFLESKEYLTTLTPDEKEGIEKIWQEI